MNGRFNWHSAMSSVSAFALAAFIGLAGQTGQGNAAGGNGNNFVNGGIVSPGGVGGINGSLDEATGKDGAVGNIANSTGIGGGGATDTSTGNGAAGGSRGGTSTIIKGSKGATGTVGLVVDSATEISTIIIGGSGAAGQAAVANVNSVGGGGGGGAGIQSSAAITVTGSVTGGSGNALATGAGGGGGVGIFSSSNVTVGVGGKALGGNGGGSIQSGSGGQGAAGVMLSTDGIVSNAGSIIGGTGGRGGINSGGGDGGAAIEMLRGGTIINSQTGVITGGIGGIGRVNIVSPSSPTPATPGDGGVGINGANITVINAGSITAGAGAAATGWTPVSGAAIHFTGGDNTLELWSTSIIVGNVLAEGTNNRLVLGGDGAGTFDANALGSGQQYDGFNAFEKTGASVWTLSNTTAEVTPWVLTEGVLSISNDLSLGDRSGALTFNGGTLQTTADITSERAVVLNAAGGTVETASSTQYSAPGVISGAGSLTKTGTGTLILAGKNTYTGETIISDGKLSLASSGDISQSSRINVAGTFDITGAGDVNIQRLSGDGLVEVGNNTLSLMNASDVFAGALSGTGTFKLASGSQTLTGNSASYQGALNVLGGVLSVDGTVGGTTNVFGGVLNGNGTVGTTTNYSGGMIAPGSSSIGKLTINGDYHSEGGGLAIRAELGGDNSPADNLTITGNAYSGSAKTAVYVTNLDGTGAPTTDGIKIITIGGISQNAFTLAGDYTTKDGERAVVAGAYAYRLYQGNGTTANDWYLRSALKETPASPVSPVPPVSPVSPDVPWVEPNIPEYQPGVPIYEAYPQALLGLNGVSTLQQRKSNRVWSGGGNRMISEGADLPGTPYAADDEAGMATEGNGIWARLEGAHSHIESKTSTTGAEYSQNRVKLQTGVDGVLSENGQGQLQGGVMLQYVHGKTKVQSSSYADGSISTDGYGFGGSLTWYGNNGFYADGQAQATWYRSDLSTSALGAPALQNGNDGFGYTFSAEVGQRVALASSWSVTPQAQIVYSNVKFDDFTDGFNAAVSLNKGDSLQSRLGLSLNNETSWQNSSGTLDRASVYGLANLYYEFLDGTAVDVSTARIATEPQSFWGGLGIGGSYNWNDDRYSLYGEGSINTSIEDFGDSYDVSGNIGLRIKW